MLRFLNWKEPLRLFPEKGAESQCRLEVAQTVTGGLFHKETRLPYGENIFQTADFIVIMIPQSSGQIPERPIIIHLSSLIILFGYTSITPLP